LRKNIKIKRLSDKLDFKKLGIFRIKKKISDINYRLKLPKIIKNYRTFYILLLKLALKNAKIDETLETEPNQQKYVIKEIINYKKIG
jgi:hypothetical protein